MSTNVECKSNNNCTLNATVNSTTDIECRSNCTPIRLYVKTLRDPEISIGAQEDDYIGNDQYSVKAAIKLDISYNNSRIKCKRISESPVLESGVVVLLQGYTCMVAVSFNNFHLCVVFFRLFATS